MIRVLIEVPGDLAFIAGAPVQIGSRGTVREGSLEKLTSEQRYDEKQPEVLKLALQSPLGS